MTRRRATSDLLFVVALLLVLGACLVSRYVKPDWTGAIVGTMVSVGVIMSFVAGSIRRVDRTGTCWLWTGRVIP